MIIIKNPPGLSQYKSPGRKEKLSIPTEPVKASTMDQAEQQGQMRGGGNGHPRDGNFRDRVKDMCKSPS